MENNNCMLYSPKEDNNTVQDCTTCERSRDCYPDYYEPPYREPFGNDDYDAPDFSNYVQEEEPDDY